MPWHRTIESTSGRNLLRRNRSPPTVCFQRELERVHPLLGLALSPAGDEQVAAGVDNGQRLGRIRAENAPVHVPAVVHQHHLTATSDQQQTPDRHIRATTNIPPSYQTNNTHPTVISDQQYTPDRHIRPTINIPPSCQTNNKHPTLISDQQYTSHRHKTNNTHPTVISEQQYTSHRHIRATTNTRPSYQINNKHTTVIPVKRLLGEERASERVSPARAEG